VQLSCNNENQSHLLGQFWWHIQAMRKIILLSAVAYLWSLTATADETRVYRWVDAEGNVHFGDSIPAEYAEFPKDVLNERGVTIDNLAGKKTEEQIEEERLASERRVAQELQQRADQALLATYLSVEEILMHRDRRIELFQAQSNVTELYLSNLSRRLELIRKEAANYRPYSESSEAPMIPSELAADLKKTKSTIERHEENLRKFKADEAQIKARFSGDIARFKILKGIDQD
jgi:hypothetical protein